jgi:hypothetical protein
MSLTSYLTDPEHSQLREKFRTYFQRPPFALKDEIKAAPLTKNYGIVGTAFDYLLRFKIERHNKNKCFASHWVADHAFQELEDRFEGDEKKEFQNRYYKAKEAHTEYLLSGRLTDELIAYTLFLAKLDLYIRSGLIASDLFYETDLDVMDLRNLYNAVNIKDFNVKKQCFLNPTFGKSSMMVGGADADMILDDTLIDIKVTKHLKLEREYLNQLLGYYIIAVIGGINGNHKGAVIKNVGIYFARYGILWKVPLSAFCNNQAFAAFKHWFVSYFDALKQERLIEIEKQLAILKKKNIKSSR